MDKMTIRQTLEKKKYKKINPFVYRVLVDVVVRSLAKKYNTQVIRNVDLKKYKKQQFILVGNHASRADYIFAAMAVGSGIPLTFVAGHNEFYRSHLKTIFSVGKVIPKKNFVADLTTIKGISSVIKDGGNIVIFPEGMSSISGAQQPVAIGSGKFLKHYKLPVLMLKIRGGYLTNTKYNMKERPGRVDVEISELFTQEQLEKLSPDEITNILNQEIYSDDYEWNKTAQVTYNCGGAPEEYIEQMLYKCPVCKSEYTIKGENGAIHCSNCGLNIPIDEKYNLTLPANSYLPATPTKWYAWQRRLARQKVMDENFKLTDRVSLGTLPDYEPLKDYKTSEKVGEGILTLDRTGITYEGTRSGKECKFHIDIKNLPTYGMCTDISFFYTFAGDNGDYLEFTPLDRNSTTEWLLCTEEMHRITGGKWQYYSWFDYEDIYDGFVKTK